MLRPRRKAAIKCEEKLQTVLKKRSTTKNNVKNVPYSEKVKVQACSVKISSADTIPNSMLSEYFKNRCSIKLIKSDNKTSKDLRNCVYTPLVKNSRVNSKKKRSLKSVKTSPKHAIENVYDFIPCSQNSQRSEDDSMKNVIKKLQSKGKVRLVKGRHNGKIIKKKDFHKSWDESNIRKAKRIIKPKVKQLSEVQIIEVLKNDAVIPIVKPIQKMPYNLNDSILPTIQDVNDDQNMDDDHFRNDDDFINDDNLNNSNIENINPNISSSKQNMTLAKPMIRSPLKPLNAQFVPRHRLSLHKDTSMQSKRLLKLSLYNQSIISSNPKPENSRRRLPINDEPKIEETNVTNYFGFTSDLTPESEFKNLNEYTSTPLRSIPTKESLIAKLKMLKTSVTKQVKKLTPRPRRHLVRSPRVPILLQEDTTINFSDALSSTLLQPEQKVNQNVRRTYSRQQNKVETKKTEVDEIFENLIGEPVEQIRNIPLDDSNPITSFKKPHVKVYERYKVPTTKENIVEDPKLQTFYQSFNMECEDVNKFDFIIE